MKKYLNHIGWSDVNPYEVVRVVSEKRVEIRAMKATELPWKADVRMGGFVAHVANQRDQKWDIKSDPTMPVIVARLGKKGWKSEMGRHVEEDAPRKFYDNNF